MFQTIVDLNSQKKVILKKLFGNSYNSEIANQFWSDADEYVFQYFHRIANNDQPYKTVIDIFKQCYEQLFPKYNINLSPKKGAEILAESHNDSELFPESLYVINQIKKIKNVCIISDTDTLMIKALLTKFGISKVYLSESYKAYKFDKSGILFKEAIKDFNIYPKEMLHIGDGSNDVLGANLIGSDSVWINRNNRVWTEEKRPTYEINSLSELIE
jgi:FMN phosphatase YigB (HAD superfamily)